MYLVTKTALLKMFHFGKNPLYHNFILLFTTFIIFMNDYCYKKTQTNKQTNKQTTNQPTKQTNILQIPREKSYTFYNWVCIGRSIRCV